MNGLFRFTSFLKYQWQAKTKYYLHSPFVYQFYLHVLEGETDEALKPITQLRKELRNNSASIATGDLGTGKSATQKISCLEKQIAVRPKYGELLYRLVNYFQPKNIIELGTSIGISSAYLAFANADAKIISLEGSAKLVELAKQNHTSLNIKNVEIITGNFSETLSSALSNFNSVDLILFDGNHTKQATLQYFLQSVDKAHEHSVFVFDDIYWSKEMNEAWQEIKQHPSITLTLDVFQFGICFFSKEKIAKEHFVLRY